MNSRILQLVPAVWALALTACTSVGTVHRVEPEVAAALLSGDALFDVPVAPDEVPDVDVLALDDAMRVFVHDEVAQASTSVARLGRLLSKLIREGYFEDDYDPNLTLTARDTFRQKSGNCLSYTNLFVALAREAGLAVHYQIVAVPPSFDASSGVLIRNNHINVLVEGGEFKRFGRRDVTIDFNTADPGEEYARERVEDRHALALYYNNLSMDALRAGDLRAAFAHVVKAIYTHPGNADFWVNLGVLYSQGGVFDKALAAHQRAIRLDPRNRPAVAGLASAYEGLGQLDRAERYRRKAEAHRKRNPYYHFALAQRAFEEARFDESMAALADALRLNANDHRFHYLKGLVHHRVGEQAAAEASLERAAELARYKRVKRHYAEALAAIQAPVQG